MEITEVRIKLMEAPGDRLQAFCSITFDAAFVVRDLKIIHGNKGPFVAMPSRKLMDRCSGCGSKNDLRAGYCNQCGSQLQGDRAPRDPAGRARLYADIAHPINSECRDQIQTRVLQAYEEELVRARQPDYVCRYDDFGEDEFAPLVEFEDEIAPEVIHRPTEDGSRRIEPAAVETNAPHAVSEGRPASVPTTVHLAHSAADNDEFGDGVPDS